MNRKNNLPKKLSHAQYIALGFALIIVLGSFLLSLPISSSSGEWTNPLTSLFTATSCTCVTGLVAVDTYTHWSLFGQLVILFLIQIGGLGFITIGVFFTIITNKKISFNTRSRLMESISANDNGGIIKLTKKIFRGTFIIEGLCSLILMIRFIPQFGVLRGFYFGIFHSISAFCNAGFDLMGINEAYSSFSAYASDPLINITLCFLILAGGLGFLVWDDISKFKLNFKKYRLHSKIVLITNLILVLGGTLLFFILEYNNTLADFSISGKICASLFDAVTPRTAGFNTTDTGSLSGAANILTWILMIIGGGSGSTAGGIKVTTVAVLFLFVFSGLRQSTETEVMQRRLEVDIIKKASMVLMINLSLALASAIIILGLQPTLPTGDVIFETVSAISTVGMTRGITRDLCAVSKIVIMLLMYLGRIGSMTFAFSLFKQKNTKILKSPVESITVG